MQIPNRRILIFFFVFAYANMHLAVCCDDHFESKIAPILIKRCIECHNSSDKVAGLDLSNQSGFEKGGESDEDLSIEDLDSNYLIEKIENGEMPPEERGVSRELSKQEKQALKKWISSGGLWHYPLYLRGRGLEIQVPGGTSYSWRGFPSTSMRRGKWKLIEFHEDNTVALYDLAEDPGETQNVATELPALTASLRAELDAWQEATNAPIPTIPNPECVLVD